MEILNVGDSTFTPPLANVGYADCGIPAVYDLLVLEGFPGGPYKRYAPCVSPASFNYFFSYCPVTDPSSQGIYANQSSEGNVYLNTRIQFPVTQAQYDQVLSKAGENITVQFYVNPAFSAGRANIFNISIPRELANVEWKSPTTGKYHDPIVLHQGNAFCLDGDMLVPTLQNGNVKVSALQVGDMISGVKNLNMEQSWCEVKVIYKTSAFGITYGGFTDQHLVVYPDSANSNNTVVAAAGTTHGNYKHSALYDVLTDCDANYNAEGTLFTPTSGEVCPTLPWVDYISVLGGFRRVMAKTGTFWPDVSVYYDNSTYTRYGGSFKGALKDLCLETLQCAKFHSCSKFELYANNFVRSHLRNDKLDVVLSAFPSLGHISSGSNGYLPGTLSATVSAAGAAV